MMARSPSGWALRTAAVILTVTLSGCGVADWFVGNNANINGAQPFLHSENAAPYNNEAIGLLAGRENKFAQVDLVFLLTDGNLPPQCQGAVSNSSQCLALALSKFYCPAWDYSTSSPPLSTCLNPTTYGELLREKRNRVQELLFAASNSACRQFTQHLNSYQSYGNFFLGSLATGAAAAGAIVSNLSAAQALAGSAAGLTGIRSEFNWDIFYHNAAAVITAGITEARYNYLLQIRGGNVAAMTVSSKPAQGTSQSEQSGSTRTVDLQALSITDYPVEAAIADALYYNDLCSLDKGLEKISQSLTLADHPGLDALGDAQQKYNDYLTKQVDTVKLEREIQTAQSGTSGTFTLSPPKLLSFGPGIAGTATTPLSLKVTNNTKATLSIAVNKIDASGVFADTPDATCASIPASQSCNISITFTRPNAAAGATTTTWNGTLVITDTGSNQSHTVDLQAGDAGT
jgi:hypothetical protein